MTYLLDTNVVSALRIRGRNQAVEAWAVTIPNLLGITVSTPGITRLPDV